MPPRLQSSALNREGDAILKYHLLHSSILQSRFAKLCVFMFLFCYVLNTLFSLHGGLWSRILPFNALIFVIVLFPLLIFRKAKLAVVPKVEHSYFRYVVKAAFSSSTYQTLAVYSLCAFSETLFLLWRSSTNEVTIKPRSFEAARLNETYVYMRFFSFYMAFVYTIVHLVRSYDVLKFPSTFKPPGPRILSRKYFLLGSSAVMALATTLTSPLVYLIFRRPLWLWSVHTAKIFYTLHYSESYYQFPFGIFLLGLCLYTSLFTFLTWEVCNFSFTVYMTLGPQHRGHYISEYSSQPNVTLISGLYDDKRPLSQIVAFQELVLISYEEKPTRRKSIFNDLDHKVPLWVEICNKCLEIMRQPLTTLRPPIKETQNQLETTNLHVPPLHVPRIKLRSSQEVLKYKDNDRANRLLSATQTTDPAISKLVEEKISKLKVLLSKIQDSGTHFLTKIIDQPIGLPFRQFLRFRSADIVANPYLFTLSVYALASFLIHSLEEDSVGIVQADIPRILQSYCEVMNAMDQYLADPPLHWADPDTKPGPVKPGKLENFESSLKAVASCLKDILIELNPYLDDMDLDPEVWEQVRILRETMTEPTDI
ncbi:hypothetical protein CANCADRAFT_108156 [Tortispora caseinolytica NRRL Y-17796]|uniref:Nucleoporin NDC1 n=1 Tax=Tortispora caseinolytica NRRL Y-17796 TaxID=767744 RepID=A0A1E4TFP2_9ASCO|nr:hypothetical protein CANCADRAFT_108156 [Tortispora caseinolytica NRRL Y-17796]